MVLLVLLVIGLVAGMMAGGGIDDAEPETVEDVIAQNVRWDVLDVVDSPPWALVVSWFTEPDARFIHREIADVICGLRDEGYTEGYEMVRLATFVEADFGRADAILVEFQAETVAGLDCDDPRLINVESVADVYDRDRLIE
jgi:hypothetical protein